MPSVSNNTNHEVTPFESISTVANVGLISDSSRNEFDIVEISKDIFTEIFPATTDENLGASAYVPENAYILVKLLGAPDYFDKFQILKVSRVQSHLTKSIILINNSNMARFNSDELTFNLAAVKSIDVASIPNLSQVFVSVPNEVYHLLKDRSQQTIKQLFVLQMLVGNGNVVNEGDTIRLINGRVNLCEPVAQGKVDLDTNFVLINQNDGNNTLAPSATSESFDDADLDLDLSSYLSSGLQFDAHSKANSATKFRVKPLFEKMNFEHPPEHWRKEDKELYAFINNSDFVKLGFPVFNGDLVKINTANEFIVVRIFSFTEPQSSFQTGCLYVSPILLINLQLGQDSEITIEPVQGDSLNSLIPVAESATISRVSSQITMDKTYQQSFFSSLKTILSDQLKCVKEGDYFPVVIDTVLAKVMFDNASEDNNDENGEQNLEVIPVGNPDAVAWFKVTDIKGTNEMGTNQFLIDPTKTLLVSSGVDSSRLPENAHANWYQYLNLPPIFDYAPSTDFKYAQEFRKILQTCLSSKINLRTSILLTSMSRGIGKTTLVRSTCIDMGLNLIELDCFDFINPGQELKTIGLLSGKIDKLIANVPNQSAFHVIYLKHIENLVPKTDENDQNSSIFASLSLKIIETLVEYLEKYSNLVIVLSCNDYDKLNDNIKSILKFTIEFTVPTENERLDIFKYLIANERSKVPSSTDLTSFPFVTRKDINSKTLALQSAGLTPRDLISIIKKSKKLAIKRLTKLSKELNIPVLDLINVGNGGVITWTPEDFEAAINEARNQFSDSIGAPRIPNVKWEDIGGLDLVKDEILDTIDMPLKHPELFNNGLKKRSGILFYGPPGTGKTLLAKAIATNFSLNFFSVKGPELLNMYIGESEANVRRVFQRARDAKPCVIFFDELDSVAPKRGNQGDSGGVMDRIVSQLLAELDGMSSEGGDGVFVVGATNRPDLLDEALLRPGRFDKMLYLGISDTDEKQTKILEALTRKFQLDDGVDLQKIAEKCSFTYTGADFYALCSDSMLNAMTRVAGEVDEKIKAYNADMVAQGKNEVNSRWWFDNVATKEDTTVLVKMEDFIKAQTELNPSVSAEELQHYLRVRENFEGGKEKAQAKLANGNEPINGSIQF
ncbi:PEX6 [Candida theae]|uniref:Peroxisomal ATPase PEX6 n=1 Tax=Candida theae TaxID=1198502 RepID=A0AAD5FZD6_9ASCO|nr:PEX6 [Candida theae]KAI5959688.1 PEX6 [Candida theae]